ncbi:unnamed protein product [Camellia sinensis]
MVMEPFLYSSLVGMTFLSCLKKLKQTVYLEIPTSFLVLPLHGSMPTINQCEIFDCPHANVRLKKQELASFAKSDEDVFRAIEQSVKRDFRVRKTVEVNIGCTEVVNIGCTHNKIFSCMMQMILEMVDLWTMLNANC